MLYCNDELVDLRKPEYKWLQKIFDEIRQMSNPVKIKLLSLPGVNPTGMKEPIPSTTWPYKASTVREGMSETWVYTKNKPNMIDGELKFSERAIKIYDGALFLDTRNQTDLIYYIVYVSGLLQKGFQLEDLEKEAEETIVEMSSETALVFYLTSELSPLLENTNKLRDMASSWGIPNAETIGINQLKLKLKDVVLVSQANYATTKRGIKEFTDEIRNMDTITKFRALLQKAIDRKLIGFNNQQNAWFWLDASTGEFSEFIVPIMPIQISQKNEILFEYFRQHAELFEIIEKSLSTVVNKEGTRYSHMTWPQLKSYASKERGINTKDKTQKQVLEELFTLDKEVTIK
jgi:hypothetical protein